MRLVPANGCCMCSQPHRHSGAHAIVPGKQLHIPDLWLQDQICLQDYDV